MSLSFAKVVVPTYRKPRNIWDHSNYQPDELSASTLPGMHLRVIIFGKTLQEGRHNYMGV